MSIRNNLETELADLRSELAALEDVVERRRIRRNSIILRLRGLPGAPSQRAVAELAGVSGPYVAELERKAGAAS